MTNRRDEFKRQTAVDEQTIATLTGGATETEGIVEALVEQQLGSEREQNRKHPKRPSEVRRRRRRYHVTFSVKHGDAVDRLRDLARQWELYTNNGALNISGVVEHLLMPQLRKAEAGEIAAPNRDGKNGQVEIESEQWF